MLYYRKREYFLGTSYVRDLIHEGKVRWHNTAHLRQKTCGNFHTEHLIGDCNAAWLTVKPTAISTIYFDINACIFLQKEYSVIGTRNTHNLGHPLVSHAAGSHGVT